MKMLSLFYLSTAALALITGCAADVSTIESQSGAQATNNELTCGKIRNRIPEVVVNGIVPPTKPRPVFQIPKNISLRYIDSRQQLENFGKVVGYLNEGDEFEILDVWSGDMQAKCVSDLAAGENIDGECRKNSNWDPRDLENLARWYWYIQKTQSDGSKLVGWIYINRKAFSLAEEVACPGQPSQATKPEVSSHCPPSVAGWTGYWLGSYWVSAETHAALNRRDKSGRVENAVIEAFLGSYALGTAQKYRLTCSAGTWVTE